MDRDAHLYTPKQISIHSLRMEGDTQAQDPVGKFLEFQSTPSVWRETLVAEQMQPHQIISIHSLRMEGDLPLHLYERTEHGISIHSLRMEGDPDTDTAR